MISSKPPGLPSVPPGFALTYGVELLYSGPPRLAGTEITSAVRQRVPVQLERDTADSIEVSHPEHRVAIKGGEMPSITKIVRWNRPFEPSDYAKALSQTWEWLGARQALERCTHKILIADFIGSGLDYRERFRLITAVTEAVASVTHPEACYWQPANCLVDPSRLTKNFARACNVRLFDDASEHDSLMDTLGLAALGVPDAQIQFSNLDRGRSAGWMYGVAKYLFDEDDVIHDGETIPGLEPGDRWTCRHEDAIVPPARVVIDITPGPMSDRRRH